MKAKYIFDNVLKNQEEIFEYLNNLSFDTITLDLLEDFYYELKSRMVSFGVSDKKIFDVCGTGGSGKTRINLSTILAIELSKNFAIAKHANKASSGKVGSVDILGRMSHDIVTNPDEAINLINKNNIVFLFAPAFHPSLIDFIEIRKKLNKSSIFNFIMPLLNPVSNIAGQMIGVSNVQMMKLMSKLALKLNKNIIFVHDLDNKLDDVSITGETFIIEVFDNKINEYIITPEKYKIPKVLNFSLIAGFDNPAQNTELATQILLKKANNDYLKFIQINKIIASEFFNKCLYER